MKNWMLIIMMWIPMTAVAWAFTTCVDVPNKITFIAIISFFALVLPFWVFCIGPTIRKMKEGDKK